MKRTEHVAACARRGHVRRTPLSPGRNPVRAGQSRPQDVPRARPRSGCHAERSTAQPGARAWRLWAGLRRVQRRARRFHWLHQRDVPATGADKRCCQLHGRSISGRIRQRDKNIHLGCWTQRPALPRILRQSCTEILTWVKVLTITRYARRPQRTFRRSGWSRSTTEQRSAIRPLPRRSSISAMSWSRVRW